MTHPATATRLATVPTLSVVTTVADITNPGPSYWPEAEEPMPDTTNPCGCYIRRPDYEAVLCGDHLAELNGATR